MGRNGCPRLGNLGAFSFTPSLWRRAMIIHCSNIPRLPLWVSQSLGNASLLSCFLFLFKLNLKHVIDHVLSEKDSRNAGAHGVYCNPPKKGSMEAMCTCPPTPEWGHRTSADFGGLIQRLHALRQTEGQKNEEAKKKEGKTIKDRKKGVTFYPCLWSGCRFTRWILKGRNRASPKAKDDMSKDAPSKERLQKSLGTDTCLHTHEWPHVHRRCADTALRSKECVRPRFEPRRQRPFHKHIWARNARRTHHGSRWKEEKNPTEITNTLEGRLNLNADAKTLSFDIKAGA